MKKFYLILVMLLPLLVSSQSYYEYFRIGDVRTSWSTLPGSIDTVLFEIHPKGLYTELTMTMDISTRGTTYKTGDSLEIQFSFTLPDKTEITDMWLWVGNTPVQADILDRWTAGLIYENIVKRRTDPAILYKYKANIWSYYSSTGSNLDLYMFRIFPLATDLPRKAKITMLIPTSDLNTANPFVTIPMNILKLSKQSISKTTFRYFPDYNMGLPVLAENPELHFSNGTDPVYGNYYETSITNVSTYKSLTLGYINPANSATFIGTVIDPVSGDKFFQMQILPSSIFNLANDKKILVLFDYTESLCNSVKGQELLNELKRNLHINLRNNDSFNLAFSGINTNFVSNKWLPADFNTIENTLNPIIASYNTYFNSYSQLPMLLSDGIDFIQQHKNQGKILLIASSESHGSQNIANGLVTDLIKQMGTKMIPINIIDLNTNYKYYSIGGYTYYGNQYLYNNLCNKTLADYNSIRNTTFANMINTSFKKLGGNFKSFDMYVTLESGFTYSNYNISNTHSIVYFDQPVQVSGKYSGSGRFHVIINGQLTNGQFLNKDYYINSSQIIAMDLVTKTIWNAWYLKDLLSLTQNNYTINQILKASIESRVLSYYTAFLALEPGKGPLPVEEENKGGGTTNIIEHGIENIAGVIVYPNPANSFVNLEYELLTSTKVVIEIYDLLGKKVISVIDETQIKGKKHLSIDVSNLKQGTYICRILTSNNNVTSTKILISR